MFDRIISVDWSGAGNEADGVDLRVAIFDAIEDRFEIVDPSTAKKVTSKWSRAEFREWIKDELKPDKSPTLLAMDFGFGLPWRSDEKLFGVHGWRNLLREIAIKYEEHEERERNKAIKKDRKGSSRSAAKAINAQENFGGHGPYRFNDNRTDYRFYVDQEVAYYRIAELCCPQAISQWYLGSGGTVGFHTISGLTAIDYLIECRNGKEIDFLVWPQECFLPDGRQHVLVESYPSICPALKCTRCNEPYVTRTEPQITPGKPTKKSKKYTRRACSKCNETDIWTDPNQEDAWKVLQMLVDMRSSGTLKEAFQIPDVPFGRYEEIDYKSQVQFEGWMIGLNGSKP